MYVPQMVFKSVKQLEVGRMLSIEKTFVVVVGGVGSDRTAKEVPNHHPMTINLGEAL